MSRVSRSDAGPDSGRAAAGIAGRSPRATGAPAIAANPRPSGISGAAPYSSYPSAATATPAAPSAPGAAGAPAFPAAGEFGGRSVSRPSVSPAAGQGSGAGGHAGPSVPGQSGPAGLGQILGSGHGILHGPAQSPHHGQHGQSHSQHGQQLGQDAGFPAFAGGTAPGPASTALTSGGLNGAGLPPGPLGPGAGGHGPAGHGSVGGSGPMGSSTAVMAAAPRKLSGRRRRETVAVLIFGGAPIFESSIPLSVFGVDRQDAGVPRYRLLVCAGEEGPLATTGGLTLSAPYGLEALARAGTIVVPAWRSISQPPPVEAITALRKAHHEGARIIGLCTGAFVLAAAGLLDGRPATTHWMYAPTLAKRYPRVHVDPRELFVDDGDVLTSAGTAAGIDLCLHVVRSDHGAEAANALARRLVVPSRRSGGGQAQYIDQSLPEEIGNDPLAEVVTWALENLNQQFDVEVLAARAYMSRRTFDRRFRPSPAAPRCSG